MKLYIVIAETGEYSDQMTFPCGVFSDKAQAQRAITEKAAQRREHDIWYEEYCRKLESLGRDEKNPWGGSYSDVQMRRAKSLIRPQPPYVAGERFEIFETTLNEWAENLETAETKKPASA